MIKDRNLNVPDEFKNLYKVADKLEQRIATLEKVLDSHAKCIGEMREDKNDEDFSKYKEEHYKKAEQS